MQKGDGLHDYVDLGLSVKWATCNVGAKNPEDYGDYYAWGETETKTNFTWRTYKYCKGTYNSLTEYNTNREYGTVDDEVELSEVDDVAHKKWGGSWRMPTKDEFAELLDNCTFTWVRQNKVYGYRVTSKKPGYTDCSIFLPAAMYYDGTSLISKNSEGYYWSSSLNASGPSGAWRLKISSGTHVQNPYGRYFGYSVRPVCP